jgi:transcriptional regulator with XRE-family HTH domain
MKKIKKYNDMKLNVFIEQPYVEGKPANLSAYIDEISGFATVGDSFSELDENLRQGLNFHADGMAKEGCSNEWILDRNWDFIYHYDLGAFINKYKGIFNQTNLARATGIHESIIRQYLSGVRNPSKKQLLRIQNNLRKFAAELSETNIL